jgi:hypothetical protein
MNSILKYLSRHKAAGIALFFAAYALYLWWGVNPSLYLVRGYREFFTDGYFLGQFFDYPGNPADYVSRFLTQFYRYPWAASLLTAAILALIYTAWAYMPESGGTAVYGTACAPVFALMLMHNSYAHSIRFDIDILFLSAALLLFTVSLRRHCRRGYHLVVYLLLLSAVFYVNGIWAALAFAAAALAAASFSERGKGIALPVGLAVGAPVVFLVFRYVFSLSIHDLYREGADMARVYPFPYYPFALYLLVGLLPFFFRFRRLPGIRWRAGAAVCALLLFLYTTDREEKKRLSVQHYALEGRWEKALDCARACGEPDRNVVYYVNEALYHTGRIHDELFLYNQSFGSGGLMAAEIAGFSEIVPNQDIFLRLGALSLSIVWGTEATNVYGANPYVLKNLVKAYLAGGYIPEAQKVTERLKHTLFDKPWADRYRLFINDTALISRDAELSAYKRAQTPIAVVSTQSVITNLYLLSKDHHLNKMAYDYLLIGALLDNRIDYFASCLARLKEYGYTHIPKLYFEGLVYYSLYAPRSPVNIREFSFAADIVRRFDAFRTDLAAFLHSPDKAEKRLKSKYGDTYWYYLLFQSPAGEEEKQDAFMRMTL